MKLCCSPLFILTFILIITKALSKTATQCPQKPDPTSTELQEENVACITMFQPVCGINNNGETLQTYSNSCFACSDKNVVSYFESSCASEVFPMVLDQDIINTIEEAAMTTITPDQTPTQIPGQSSGFYACPKIRAKTCPPLFKPVCGLYDSTSQCLVSPCGQEFDNECLACQDEHILEFYNAPCVNLQEDQTIESSSNEENFEGIFTYEETEQLEEHQIQVEELEEIIKLDELSEEQFVNEEQTKENKQETRIFDCPQIQIDVDFPPQLNIDQFFIPQIIRDSIVCGILEDDVVINCITFPCETEYRNYQTACSDPFMVQFFVGTCQQYRKYIDTITEKKEFEEQVELYDEEILNEETSSTYSYPPTSRVRYRCPKNRSDICQGTLPFQLDETCGLLSKCVNVPCEQTYENRCSACSDLNVDYYYPGPCDEYPQVIQVRQDKLITEISLILTISTIVIIMI